MLFAWKWCFKPFCPLMLVVGICHAYFTKFQCLPGQPIGYICALKHGNRRTHYLLTVVVILSFSELNLQPCLSSPVPLFLLLIYFSDYNNPAENETLIFMLWHSSACTHVHEQKLHSYAWVVSSRRILLLAV